MTTKQRFEHILTWFETNMPVAESELVFANPFQCLVAVMLSAQCTDKRVNMVTPALFAAYPTPEAMAKATSDEVFEYVKSVSYPRSKSEHLVEMAKRLVEVYSGQVPDTIEELQTLQGVGRKTANVVCAVIWNQPTMAVDTHIFRVSERLGLRRTVRIRCRQNVNSSNISPRRLFPRRITGCYYMAAMSARPESRSANNAD